MKELMDALQITADDLRAMRRAADVPDDDTEALMRLSGRSLPASWVRAGWRRVVPVPRPRAPHWTCYRKSRRKRARR